MALMRLKSYVDEHAKPIEKISRFNSINDDMLIYNTGFKDKFIAVAPNSCKYIQQPELVVKEESDIVPIEDIELESNGLTATSKILIP